MTDYSASPTTLRRLANNMRVQQDFIEVEYELFDAIADKWEKDRAEVRKLRAMLGRLQGEVETILNTEPHAPYCRVISRECNCWQARLTAALDGDK